MVQRPPPVNGLLTEYADSLLAHWKTERYPRLAKSIFFADDRVENRDAPNSETFNIFWGLYDINRNEDYLWLLCEAVKAGDVWNASFTNGFWPDAAGLAEAREALVREVERRNIFDHNLQTD